MTEDDDVPPDSAAHADPAAARREAARQLLLKVGRSVPLQTERLGAVQARGGPPTIMSTSTRLICITAATSRSACSKSASG